MLTGFNYQLTIYNIRNPDSIDLSGYKYVIEISTNSQQFITYRSFDSTTNYVI